MSTSYKDFDVQEVLSKLTHSEKVKLLSGSDFWHLSGVQRLGIPAIRTSDGPNGVRGTKFFNGVPAACLPCGTALGATWDVDLVRRGGELMGREAIAKGASVLLGPTINMQRSPLGGRGFESYSEDPVLAGNLAAASVTGIQSTGVAATLKHFVCNDLEDKRMASNSVVSERALREIYLLPFQIAQRDAKPMAFMTAYNLVNGVHCSESPQLLQNILRDEWKFDGLVMSDWFGVYSTTESVKAGLDLEMPGPTALRGRQIDLALRCGKLAPHDLDARAVEVLKFIKKVLPLQIPERAVERAMDSPETAALLRELSADSIVLLKNDRAILPFDKRKSIAVIGPNAAFAAYCGGGSASLPPYYAVPPLDGIKSQAKSVQYALGVPGWNKLPLLSHVAKTDTGEPGLIMKIYKEAHGAGERKAIDDMHVRDSNMFMFDYNNPQLRSNLFYADIDCTFTPEDTTEYEFSCSVAGTAKIFVDGKLVVDNMTKQRPGGTFFGVGTREEVGGIALTAGTTYHIHVEFGSLPTLSYSPSGATAMGAGGIRLGCYRKINTDVEIQKAVDLARTCEQVVLCVGLNGDFESEGFDRRHMDLPRRNDELIAKVLAANPRTAVVLQSGTPVTMPWADKAPAIVQAWYGGNETGNAIADVVLGAVNPSGKLSLSFPNRNEDNPAFHNYKSDDNRVLYGEDVYVGYRFYETLGKEVLFPFGHGLSYTRFELRDLKATVGGESGNTISVEVSVTNAGSIAGREVIQVYVAPPTRPSVNRPKKELKGFAKTSLLQPGSSTTIHITMDKRFATSFYSEGRAAWVSEMGEYSVLVGTSSASTPLHSKFKVNETVAWRGMGEIVRPGGARL